MRVRDGKPTAVLSDVSGLGCIKQGHDVMKKILITTLFALAFAAPVNAATISATSSGFTEFGITSSQVRYFDATPSYYDGSGYGSVADASSTNYVAYNRYGSSPSSFTWTGSGSIFDLGGFTIAGAWGSQTLTIQGFNGATLIGSATHFVTTAADLFIANWEGLTSFVIFIGNDFIQDSTLPGEGQHWALNDIVVNEFLSVSEVPIPAAAFLFAPALLGFITYRRKLQADAKV